MKILSVGNFGTGWDGSICDEEHIASALESLGHEVQRCQRGEYHFVNNEPEFDFVLLSQWDGYDELFIPLMRETIKAPIVYWAFDYQADGQEWHERLVREADLYLSKRIADDKYRNWQWFSQDFAPQFLTKAPDVAKDIDVLFTGSYLPWATERNEIIEAVGNRFNLVIHSTNQWPQGNEGPVMDDALPGLIARAKINISIDHTIEAGYWSDRNAQIMCCGGFVLSRYVPLMESVFKSHITYFFNKQDALDSVQYWLEAEEDREMIAAQAYEWSAMYKAKEKVADLLNIVRNIL